MKSDITFQTPQINEDENNQNRSWFMEVSDRLSYIAYYFVIPTLFCYALLACFWETFQLNIANNKQMIFLLGFLIFVCIWGLFISIIHFKKLWWLIGSACQIFILLRYKENLIKGFEQIKYNVVERFSKYYNFENTEKVTEFDERSVMIALLFLALFLMYGIVYHMFVKPNRLWSTLFVIVVWAMALSCGQLPSEASAIMLLVAYYALMCRTKKSPNGNENGIVFSAGMIVIVAVIANIYLVPTINPKLDKIRDFMYESNLKEKFDALTGGKYYEDGSEIEPTNKNPNKKPNKKDEIDSGMAFGKMGMYSLKTDQKTHLEVSFKKDAYQATYLKGFAATQYTSNGWVNGNSYKSVESLWESIRLSQYPKGDFLKEQILSLPYINMKAYDANVEVDSLRESENRIYIKNVAADKKVTYVPYNASIGSLDGILFRDLYLLSNGSVTSSYDLFTENVEKVRSHYENEGNRQLIKNEYDKYAYDTYLNVPESLENLPFFFKEPSIDIEGEEAIDWEQMKTSYQYAIDYVRKKLHKTTTYTTTPKNFIKEGQDPIEYFLFDGKEGYCLHYASAATLLLRYLGYPARYCEGYVVPPAEAGKTVLVAGKNAHAWTEIYAEEFGWIPVEVTPTYYETDSLVLPEDLAVDYKEKPSSEQASVDKTNEEHKPTKPIKPSKPSQMTSASSESKTSLSVVDQTDRDSLKAIRKIVITICVAIIIIAAFYAILITWRIIRLKQRRHGFNQQNLKKRCRYIYAQIATMTRRFGEPIHFSLEEKEQLREKYPVLSEQAIENLLSYIREVNFSDHELIKEDSEEIYEIYALLRDALYSRLSIWKKFLFKFICAYI